MPSGRPTSPASSFTSMEAGRELTVPVRPRKTSHNGALLFKSFTSTDSHRAGVIGCRTGDPRAPAGITYWPLPPI
jgi:hypothetical protein